jgi:hypothetical protein
VSSAGAALAALALAAAGPLLVAGVITLSAQFVVAGVGLPIVFGWLWRAGRTARHSGALPARTARAGELIARAALAGTVVAVAALLLPTASAGQIVALCAAAVAGLPAYLAFPVWLIAAGRAWLSGPGSAAEDGERVGLGSELGGSRSR